MNICMLDVWSIVDIAKNPFIPDMFNTKCLIDQLIFLRNISMIILQQIISSKR